MNRSVRRERQLPAFALTLGELGALWARLDLLFQPASELYSTSISVRLPSEELTFYNVDELREYVGLPATIKNFSISFADHPLNQPVRRIRIRTAPLLNSVPYVIALSESEAWSAGAIDACYTFIRNYTAWYSWFLSMPAWVLLILFSLQPISFRLLPADTSVSSGLFFTWIALLVLIMILYFGQVFPSAVIRTSDRKFSTREYIPELSLGIAVLTLMLMVIQWLFPKLIS